MKLVENNSHAQCVVYVVTRDDRFGSVGICASVDEAARYLESEQFVFDYETDMTFAFKKADDDDVFAVIRMTLIDLNEVWAANRHLRVSGGTVGDRE